MNITLLHALRSHGYTRQVALAAFSTREAERFKQSGTDGVMLLPLANAAERAVELLSVSPVLSLKFNTDA
jgi:hypothetical protein